MFNLDPSHQITSIQTSDNGGGAGPSRFMEDQEGTVAYNQETNVIGLPEKKCKQGHQC